VITRKYIFHILFEGEFTNGLQFFVINSHRKIKRNNMTTETIVAVPALLFFKKKIRKMQSSPIATNRAMLNHDNL